MHASWLNQVEIYFSILQRKALTPNDFATLPDLPRHITDFAQHYRTRPTVRVDLHSRQAQRRDREDHRDAPNPWRSLHEPHHLRTASLAAGGTGRVWRNRHSANQGLR